MFYFIIMELLADGGFFFWLEQTSWIESRLIVPTVVISHPFDTTGVVMVS